MPTKKPRLGIVLNPHTFDVLRRLSELNKQSMASIVTELLQDATPQLEQAAVLIERAQQVHEEARASFRRNLDDIGMEMVGAAGKGAAQMDFLIEQTLKSGRGDPGELARVVGVDPAAQPATQGRKTSRATPGKAKPKKAGKGGL